MANRFVFAHIRNLPLLAQIPPDLLELIADAVEIVQLQPGQMVFRQGQPGQGLFLLVNGQAELLSGAGTNERVIGVVNANQYVGEAALFENTTERMSMRVTQPSVLLFLPRLKFQQVLLEHPEIRPHLASQHAQFGLQAASAFAGQRPGEQMLLRQKRHHWAFVRHSILPVLIGIALIAVGIAVASTGLTLVIFALAVIVPGLWIYYAYVEWQNDYLIITDERIIHHTRTILSFQQQTREIIISSVHEASYNIPPADPFARLFNYGTIYIKTAGEAGNVEITLMPNPEHIQRVLITDLQNFRRKAEQQNRAAINEAIDQFLMPGEANTKAQLQQDKPPVPAQNPGLLGTRSVDGQGNIIYRKHLSIWLAHVMLPGLFVLAGLALILFGLMLPGASMLTVGLALGPFVTLIGMVWFYWADWDWRHDILILGRSTIRIVHRRPLWLQDISEEVLLERVDDVVVYRNGLVNTLLNRGDLSISLIGDDFPKRFNGVGNPADVKNEIFERRAALKNREEEEHLMRQREEIARYLDVYHERVRSTSQHVQPQDYDYPSSPQPPFAQPPFNPNPQPQPPPTPGRQGPRPPRVPRTRDDHNQ
jgi:hypothetical protein